MGSEFVKTEEVLRSDRVHAERGEVPEVPSRHEADFRVEVGAGFGEAEAAAPLGLAEVVADEHRAVVTLEPRRIGLGDVGLDRVVFADAPLAVDGVGAVRVVMRGQAAHALAADEDTADAGAFAQFPVDAGDGVVVAVQPSH